VRGDRSHCEIWILDVTCDAKTLYISFNSPSANGGLAQLDSVCVNLKTGQLMTSGTAKKSGAKTQSKASSKTPSQGLGKTKSKVSTKSSGAKTGSHTGSKAKH
jgi:hypothetical protein